MNSPGEHNFVERRAQYGRRATDDPNVVRVEQELHEKVKQLNTTAKQGQNKLLALAAVVGAIVTVTSMLSTSLTWLGGMTAGPGSKITLLEAKVDRNAALTLMVDSTQAFRLHQLEIMSRVSVYYLCLRNVDRPLKGVDLPKQCQKFITADNLSEVVKELIP